MLKPGLLRGNRVRLAAVQDTDLRVMAGWQEDIDSLRNLDAEPAIPRTEAQLKLRLEEQRSARGAVTFAIRLIEADELIGVLDLEGLQSPHRSAWLAIQIGAGEQRGRGYGSEALDLALEFAFHELNLHRVQLTVFAYNTRAIAAYERLGFVREGVYREALERDGRRHDMLLYGILRREWQNRSRPGASAESPQLGANGPEAGGEL
jgi:RimJ/RimL family protein N-acetyltransferase